MKGKNASRLADAGRGELCMVFLSEPVTVQETRAQAPDGAGCVRILETFPDAVQDLPKRRVEFYIPAYRAPFSRIAPLQSTKTAPFV